MATQRLLSSLNKPQTGRGGKPLPQIGVVVRVGPGGVYDVEIGGSTVTARSSVTTAIRVGDRAYVLDSQSGPLIIGSS